MSSLCLELWAAVITQINPLGLATVEKESSEEQMAMRACESFLRVSWEKGAARHRRPQPIVLKLPPEPTRGAKSTRGVVLTATVSRTGARMHPLV